MLSLLKSASIACLLLITTQNGNAKTVEDSTEQEIPWHIKLTPVTCMVNNHGDRCNLSITISSTSSTTQQTCLFRIESSPSPLWCGTLGKNYKVVIQDTPNKNQKYYLSDGKRSLSSELFRVGVYQPAKTRKRRRYGLGM